MVHKILSSPINRPNRPALFLDRDGVINRKPPDQDYVKNWNEFKFNSDAFSLIEWANQQGYPVIIVTNQRGIARQLMTHAGLTSITYRMIAEIQRQNLEIGGIFYCPHDFKDNCSCRKPKPGLILEAAKSFQLDIANSIIVGDSEYDLEAGRQAKIRHLIKIPIDLPGVALPILKNLTI